MTKIVFTVHVTKPDDVGAIEIVFPTEREALSYGRDRSRDHRILSASVTRFAMSELGTRHPVAWFINGEEQPMKVHGPHRPLYPADGWRRAGG